MRLDKNFTEGAIFLPLMGFAAPVLGAMLLQTLYGAVDLMIVGQFCAASEIAAVSIASAMMMALTIIILGLSLGTTVLLGQKYGEGRFVEMGGIVGGSVALFAQIGAFLTVAMQFAAPCAARIMRVPAESFSSAVAYVRICSGGALFIVAYNVLGSVFRGLGDSRTPLVTVAIACGLNIVGDLLFVAVFRLGARGAAIATVLAQAASVVLSLLIVRKNGLPFEFGVKDISLRSRSIKRVLRIGFPVAFQDVLVQASFLCIGAIVNSLGVVPAAGVGIAERVCGFVMLVPSAYGQAMATFAAQNFGAGKPDRAARGLACAILSSLAVGLFMGWATFFHGDAVTSLFVSDEPEVALASWEYLKAYSIDCLLTSFLFCMVGYFNGLGRTSFVMWQGIIGAFCVRIPVSWIMSRMEPVSIFRIGLATPCSSIVQVSLCLLVFFGLTRRRSRA